MKRLLALVTVVASFSLLAMGADTTLRGRISNEMCAGKAHMSAACIQKCTTNGSAPVLMSRGKTYKIANPDQVKDQAGKFVEVTGSLDGDTLTVSSVTPIQRNHSSSGSSN